MEWVCITDNPEEFAKRSIELYQDEKIWLNAQKKGVQIINQCYDKERFEKVFIELIEKTLDHLKEHRLHNFTGAMLQHHMMKSTKYLSKWIEQKNKQSL